MSIFRIYLIDTETGRELKEHPANGKTWIAGHGYAMGSDGKFVEGTCTGFTCADYADLHTVKGERKYQAQDFERMTTVRFWFGPGNTEEYVLQASAKAA